MLFPLLVALVVSVPNRPAQDAPPADVRAEWAEEMEAALTLGDREELARLFDYDALVDTVVRGVEGDDEFARGYRKGLREQLESESGLLGSVAGLLGEDGRVDLLRFRGTAEASTALFRVVMDDSFGYFEFDLVRRGDAIRAVDVYQAASGERLSASLRRFFVPLAAARQANFMDRLLGDEHVLARNWKKVERVVDAANKGKLDVLEKRFAELPEELRGDKCLILLLVKAYPAEDSRYAAAVADLVRLHPGDPAAELAAIDHHFLRGDVERALASLDALGKSFGGDPYVDYVAAGLLYASNDLVGAARRCRAAIDAGLGWENLYWFLVAIALAREQHAETLALLLEMDARFQIEWSSFEDNETYAKFTASADHARWLAHLAAKERAREGEPR